MDEDAKAVTENITINFHYFIQLAIRKEIPWKSLAFMLTDLTTSLDKSKQVIRVLVQELEKLASKVENETNDVAKILETNEKQGDVQMDDASEYLECSEEAIKYINISDLDDKNIVPEIEEPTYELKEEDSEVSNLYFPTEFTQNEQNKSEIDFLKDESYKCISDNEKSGSNDKVTVKTETKKEMKNQCRFCNKCLHSKSHREIHERIHTGERPFKCESCDKSFNRPDSLVNHRVKHTGEKPFCCKICQKRFFDRINLIRHERRSKKCKQ